MCLFKILTAVSFYLEMLWTIYFFWMLKLSLLKMQSAHCSAKFNYKIKLIFIYFSVTHIYKKHSIILIIRDVEMILISVLNLFMAYLDSILEWLMIIWTQNLNRSEAVCRCMLFRDVLEHSVFWGPLKQKDSVPLLNETILATIMFKIHGSLCKIQPWCNCYVGV